MQLTVSVRGLSFFVDFFFVVFLCFMVWPPCGQWHGSLALAKPIRVKSESVE